MEEMSYEEFQKWNQYLEKRPPSWRDDNRTYMVLRSLGVKEAPGKVFSSLAPIFNSSKQSVSENGKIDSSFVGSEIFSRMQKAKGGENIHANQS